MSKKLTSLVKAAPQLVPYTLMFLGKGLPPKQIPDHGFIRRVEDLRKQIAVTFINSLTPLTFTQGGQQLLEVEQQRLEDALLDLGEHSLTMKLFQTSSVMNFLKKLSVAKPEELQKLIGDKNPLVRLLVINTIRRRFIHLELELIERLSDPVLVVRDAAHAALARVTHGTDFGPPRGASRRGMERSVEKWNRWLALQKSESPEMLAKEAAIAAAGKQVPVVPLELEWAALVREEQREASPEATKWSDKLVNAKGGAQLAVLARLRDSGDIANADALALAIPRLSGAIQGEARNALTQRLSLLTEETLRDKLQDDNIEMRRAAALACGRTKHKEHIPDLMQLLDDPEMDVIQAARVSLSELTGKDFGPASEASARGRTEAAVAWREWWKERQERQK